MVNEDRVKIMTRLASYENGRGKEELKLIRYNRKDYVSFHVLATAIWFTIGYAAVLGLAVFLHIEFLISNIQKLNMVLLGIMAVSGYIALLVIYLLIAGKVYRKRHNRAKENARLYYMDLRRLNKLYEKERQQTGVFMEPEGDQ